MRRATAAVVGALLVAAVALRVWAVTGDRGLLDGDEAVVGLQALRAAHGDEATFFLGQPYGGTLEALLMSVPMRAVGAELWVVRAVAIALAVAAAVVVGLLARKVLADRPGAPWLAGALLAAWPPIYVWFGTRSLGFYLSSLLLGLATCLLLAVVADDQRWRWYGLLGIVAGLAWWQSPYLAYFALPGVAWLALHGRWAALARLPLAVPTAVLGAAPWLLYNLDHSFRSLDTDLYGLAGGSYAEKVWYVVHTGLPIATGLKAPFSAAWSGGWLGQAVYVVVTGGVLVAVVVGLRARRLWALGLVAFPLVFAVSPLAPTPAHGRYFLYLAPWLALLVADLACRSRAWLAASASAVAVTTAFGLVALDLPWRGVYGPDTGAARAALRVAGVDHVFADYFIAYRLVFESDEEVLATPFQAVRDPRIDAAVRADDRPGYLFGEGDPALRRFLAWCDGAGVAVEVREVDGYTVAVPARRVLPEEVGGPPLGT